VLIGRPTVVAQAGRTGGKWTIGARLFAALAPRGAFDNRRMLAKLDGAGILPAAPPGAGGAEPLRGRRPLRRHGAGEAA